MRALSTAAAAAITVTLAAAVGLVWVENGREPLTGLVTVGCCVLAVLTWVWAGPGRRPSASTRAQLTEARDSLARAVRAQWAAEASSRNLHDPQPLRLRWTLTRRPVADHPRTALGSAVLAGTPAPGPDSDLDRLVDFFERLPSGRMVILGEPGGGKTVAAVLLVLGALSRRRPDGPVPVLLSLSTWNPTGENFYAWARRRLGEDYPWLGDDRTYGATALAELAGDGSVVYVLDGLDEIDENLRFPAVRELNQVLHGGQRLVLTCRAEEYQDTVVGNDVLTGAAVVELGPVRVDDLETYLRLATPPDGRQQRWNRVFEHLREQPDSALASALTTPLMASLAGLVYSRWDADPGRLLEPRDFPDRAAIEQHLLDQVIPIAFSAQPVAPPDAPSARRRHRRWDPDQAARWLAFLAVQPCRGSGRDLEWWQLHRAVPRAVIGLWVGVAAGAVCGLASGIVGGLVGGLSAALVFGLLAGCVTVLLGPGTPSRLDIRVRRRQRPLLDELLTGLAGGVAVGLAIGLVGGLAVGLVVGVTSGLAVGLAYGLVFGLADGLASWLAAPTQATHPVSPVSLLRRDRLVATVRGTAIGVAGGLVSGTACTLVFGPAAAIPGAISGGVAGVLARGLMGTAWAWFLVARTVLAVRRRLPWRLVGFLQDAYARGVLRQAGSAYQFRHARMQDRLATRPPDGPGRRTG
ncbi:NACHT domain-containing protein [Goodfellowiella coeruleoviolacea]|uniref:NACHT domain-containing protein n=2 Tax=Goodfellowiella coeruleoviolacea TaxID=334858 RepID=A0AAE3KLK5_9PSEU|nr:NACHT domain-containing protein [Goodfellowiella coeruleoviolacea]